MDSHVCPWWLGFVIDNPLRRIVHRPQEMLRRHVREGWTVLDVGCGTGLFSLALARLVGPEGRVLAVDLQPGMLSVLHRRARRAGLGSRIETRICRPDDLGVDEAVDFALAFWMVHEVGDDAGFYRQIRAVLAPAGRLLVVEPLGHVPARAFEASARAAREAGLVLLRRPYVALSRAALWTRAPRRAPMRPHGTAANAPATHPAEPR